MSSETQPPDKWLSFGFALVGGFGDAAGYILTKTFTGHITGSLVLGAIAVASHDWRGAFARFLAVVCFLAGIPLSITLIARLSAKWPYWPQFATVTALETALIVAAYFALASRPIAAVEISVICLSLALGLQNGAFRRRGGISVHTTYLTGLITGLIAIESEKLAFPVLSHRSTTSDPKSDLHWGVWGAFVVGALIGAVAVFQFKELGILGASLILLAIFVRDALTASQLHSAN